MMYATVPQESYTITDVARLCGVHPDTVRAWIDTGAMPAYIIPQTTSNKRSYRMRRILFAELLKFAKDTGMIHVVGKLTDLLPGYILMVGVCPEWVARLRELTRDLNLQEASTIESAGKFLLASMPAGVVLDFSIGRDVCEEIACTLREDTPRPTLIGLCAEDGPGSQTEPFDLILQQPVNFSRFRFVAASKIHYR